MTESLHKEEQYPLQLYSELGCGLPQLLSKGNLDWSTAGHLQPHVSAAPTRKGTALTYRGLASLQQQPRQQIRAGITCKETAGLVSM